MSYNKEAAIAAQNAGSTAAALYAAVNPGPEFDAGLYNSIRDEVFNGTMRYAGAAAIVETVETPQPGPHSNTSGGGGYDSGPGGVVIKFGKYAGKTIAQLAGEDPAYLDWAAENLKNDFLRNKIQEFQAA